MKLTCCALVVVAFVLALGTFPVTAQEHTSDIEDELQALVRATTRLVESLERRERAESSDHQLQQIQVAVRILDIRVRQQESFQSAMDSVEGREQRLHGWIAGNEVRVENLKQQIAKTLDESKKLELQLKLQEQVVYLENRKKELEYATERHSLLQTHLLDGDRLVREIEDLVQTWVGEVQNEVP